MEAEKLLVAAYCRVSTDRTDQANSLRSQWEYFHTGWRLAQVYADEGLSGTSIRRRAAFQQMMEDAAEGRFGLILTKEVSRFARNTVDTLAYTRRLKELGVGVVFGSDSTYGFETRGGALTIRPAEAEVVRLIYDKYLAEGKGVHVIARELNQAGIMPPRAECRSENTILHILRNEKYAGDLLQKKYVTVDYLTRRKVENRGQEEQIFLRDHHQAIVDRETWEGVQRELTRRSAARQGGERHSARYWPSGRGGAAAAERPMSHVLADGRTVRYIRAGDGQRQGPLCPRAVCAGASGDGRRARTGRPGGKNRADAEHRLRRALEGYLDGVITAKELEAIRAQCSQETEAADAEAKAEPLRLPEVSAGL